MAGQSSRFFKGDAMNRHEAIVEMVCKGSHLKIPKDKLLYRYHEGNFFHGSSVINPTSMPRRDLEVVTPTKKYTYCYRIGDDVQIRLTVGKYINANTAVKAIKTGEYANEIIEIFGPLYESEEMVY